VGHPLDPSVVQLDLADLLPDLLLLTVDLLLELDELDDAETRAVVEAVLGIVRVMPG
jgi:hypothetical protein